MSDQLALVCHPAAPAPPGVELKASVCADGQDGISCRFLMAGNLGHLIIPAPRPSAPADDLWQHTCFELFAKSIDGVAYREFNFSPDGRWAAYAFGSYRERSTDGPSVSLAPPTCQIFGDCLELTAVVPGAWLPSRTPLRLGLTAVLEARDGRLSYWALTHHGPRPDFHDPRGFILAYPEFARSSP
ncbi:MAG TPA: DOMON-like domain-containing protein [Rhodocyclaceae bacterium]|nr:DOMON-like domain-containing protein [Rhodocyclaceae bacterium]